MIKSEKELYFNRIDEVVDEVISLLSETLDINSIFITNIDRQTNFIVKAFNRKLQLLHEGESMNVDNSLCKLIIEQEGEPLVVPNIAENPVTANHPGAERIRNGSYIGIPIFTSNKLIFGTLCAADIKPYDFSPYEIKLIKTLALLLSQSIVLEDLMVRDLLTGLYNRSYLIGHFERNRDEEQQHALMYIDLDHFKPINDEYGHEAGDEVLKQVSGFFRDLVPDGSISARIGGDEFIILIPVSSEEMNEAKDAAGRIMEQLRGNPIKVQHAELLLSASIGLAYAYPGKDLPDLMSQADSAMYKAKRGGRNTVEFYGSK